MGWHLSPRSSAKSFSLMPKPPPTATTEPDEIRSIKSCFGTNTNDRVGSGLTPRRSRASTLRKAGSPEGALAAQALSPEAITTLESVLAAYGERSGRWLSELTHREVPWRAARAGLPDEAPSKAEISIELMKQTYGSHKYGTTKQFSQEYLRGLELLGKTVDSESTLRWLETGIEE